MLVAGEVVYGTIVLTGNDILLQVVDMGIGIRYLHIGDGQDRGAAFRIVDAECEA
jgi:hypothetical protein